MAPPNYTPHALTQALNGLVKGSVSSEIGSSYVCKRTYISDFESFFSHFPGYQIETTSSYVLGRVKPAGMLVEVYASSDPVSEQLAYRHYRVMERLVEAGGEVFCQHIRALKRQGYKTEPAICAYLCLRGDPYYAILEIENWSQEYISVNLQRAYEKNLGA